jgi:uncharacterized protein YbjT (DUF2867 family)/FAD/FMN-containing dehydrogenase
MTATIAQIKPELLQHLRVRLRGTAVLPGDPGYDNARRAWNLNAIHRPAVVVLAQDADDISTTVRFARSAGLGVGVLATGHGTGLPCADGLLINTSRMRRVRVDPVARIARVAAGVVWNDVVPAAAAHGLVGLPGSSTTVGVVGYTLGGGFGWLGRRYGLAAHTITSADLVMADGERITASRDEHQELFWGLQGGTGNLGIVTALEFALHPVSEVYGGNLYYPLPRARDVLEFFAEWSRSTPSELTAAATFRSFPPLPAVPEPLRGRSFIAVRGCYSGELAAGRALVNQARAALGPAAVDTFAAMPAAALAGISLDPVDPLGAISHSELIRDLTPETIDALVEVAGPQSGSPLVMVELRQLGGALAGSAGALSPMAHTAAGFSLNAIGVTNTPQQAAAVRTQLARVATVLGPHCTGETYLNFLDLDGATPQRIRSAYSAADWSRLTRLKARYDPDNVFRFNRNIPGAVDTHQASVKQELPAKKASTTMSKILVTGATGTIGSPLVAALRRRGSSVRAMTHNPDHAEQFPGVDLAYADFADVTSIRRALRDVDAVFLACGNVPDQVAYECAMIDEAARSGVRRIVKLSARGAQIGSPVAYWDWHGLIERHLQESAIPSVVLQPGFLMTNLLAAAEQVRHGVLFAPAGTVPIAMIHPADVAAVAAVALTANEPLAETYVLTGPDAITYHQVALDLAAAIGQPVDFVDIPSEAATAALLEAGLPPFVAAQVVTVFGELRAGVQASTTNAVQLVTGRPARPFAMFARDHVAAFRATAAGGAVKV